MFKGGSLWGGLISGGMAQLKDTQAMTSGHMNKKEYAIQTSKNLTGSIGVMAGIEYGAILGSSIFPGPGTIIGAVIGAWLEIGLEIMQVIKLAILFSIIRWFITPYRMMKVQN